MDPRGLELVTSTMRRRLEAFAVVRECFESRLFKLSLQISRSRSLVGIRPGYCQATVTLASTTMGLS